MVLQGSNKMGAWQNGAILSVKRCKLGQKPLDEGPRSRRGKVRCLLHGIILEGNTNGLNQEVKLEGELMFWIIILESMV